MFSYSYSCHVIARTHSSITGTAERLKLYYKMSACTKEIFRNIFLHFFLKGFLRTFSML